MSALIIGLIIFLATHSVRIFAEAGRAELIAQKGLLKYKLAYSIVSLIGLALIIWGYGAARLDPVYLWFPPVWARHLAAVLTLPAFILLAAAYVPRSRIKAGIGHPMAAAVKLWALSHLLANGTLADLLLFGGFLVWAIAVFASARRRDRAMGVEALPGSVRNDALALVAGCVAWFVFARYLHTLLFGIAPFG